MKAKAALLLFTLALVCGCGKAVPVQEQVTAKYTAENGLIHAYPGDQNSEYLSESIGLYMEYLVLAGDSETFAAQFESLQNHFLVQDGELNFIRWRLDASTNALVDDLRIIRALEQATETFGEKEYKELADRLSETIVAIQSQDNMTVDFYDWSLNMPARRLTLSYVDGNKAISDESFKLLENIPADGTFFPEYYDTAAGEYVSSGEVHMIDQLLIALNREKRGQPSEVFTEWLTEEWEEHGKIYGRYDRKTEETTVKYESLAVYYYLQTYFTVLDEPELAADVSRHTEKIATARMLRTAHFFDFIHYQLMQES